MKIGNDNSPTKENLKMQRILYTLTVAILVLGMCSAGVTSSIHYYAITNNDNPTGNTATVWEYQPSPPAIVANETLAPPPADTQYGLGGGYYSVPRVTVANNLNCIFVSNALGDSGVTNYGSITTYERVGSSFLWVGNYNDGFTLDGEYAGIGLALSPDGHTLYAAYSGSGNVASWAVAATCALTFGAVVPDPAPSPAPAPIVVSSDGNLVVISDPGSGYVTAYPVTGITFGTPVLNSINTLIPACSGDCAPEGLDLTAVVGGSMTVIAGNGDPFSPPSYILGEMATTGTSAGVLTAASFGTLPLSTGLVNVASAEFSRAAYTSNSSGTVYFGASGFTGGSGVASGSLTVTLGVPSIAYDHYYPNSTGYDAGNISIATVNTHKVGIWTPPFTGVGGNYVYLYSGTGSTGSGGTALAPVAHVANPNGSGSEVLSIVAYPGR